ncbi:MAG: hypothetical protein IPK12_23435 [Gemmatimonadetes bacterium]|nr:hypothetical protein [Gemmatimonadota bacterium]
MARRIYAVELVAYDPAAGATTTLRYATTGFATRPTDTPASTYFDGRIRQAADVARFLFGAGTTSGRSRTGYGDLVLANGDGGLDGLLLYGLSGRAITIRRGVMGAAYPSAWQTVLVATMEQPEAQGDSLVIRIRDKAADLETPFQATKYAGTNTLPDGLEGVATDLLGKPKPVAYGECTNVPAILVNSAKLIYQVADAALASISAVYDRGIRLGENLDSWGAGASLGTGTDLLQKIATGVYGASPLVPLTIAVGANGKVAYTINGGTSWVVDGSTGFGATNLVAIGFGTVEDSATFPQGYVIAGAAGALRTFSAPGTPTSRTSGFGADTIRAVCYGAHAKTWVAVGDAGKISSSTDYGATWTAQTSGVATALYGVAAGNGIFVAVGAGGVVLTSTDGTTWASRTGGFGASDIWGIVFGQDRFVAVGASEKANVSLNGTSWPAAAVTVGLATYASGGSVILRGVAYDSGLFVAAGEDESIATSVNGFDWTVRNRTSGSTTECYSAARYPDGHWFVLYQDSGLPASGVYQPPAIGTYASTTALQDDSLAPAPGTFKTLVGSGYFRLGSPPAGQVTADIAQGAAAANRTAGQLFAAVLQRAGKSAGDWSAADVTALDAAQSGILGFWTAEETTFAEVLDQIAASVGAWWGVDRLGIYRIQRFTAPSGRPVLQLTANDLLEPLRREATTDDGKGLPTWRTVLRYARNFTVQERDVAWGVTDARRAFLATSWRETVAEDTAVKTAHLLAGQTLEETLLVSSSVAGTEATRRQTLRGRLRHRFTAVLALTEETEVIDLGDVVHLTHPRFNLAGGARFRVVGLEPDARRGRLRLALWGWEDPGPGSVALLPVLAGAGTVT